MKKKLAYLAEIIWLLIGLFGLFAGTHRTYQSGFSESWPFYVILVIALLMYSYRRFLRKMTEKKEQEKQDAETK